MQLRPFRSKGFTLAEMVIVAGIVAIVSGGVYAFVHAGTVVSAKALAGSSSSTASRLSMDRMIQSLQLAYNTPTLISHTGTAVTGTGPAQGIRFLRYMGAPYVVTMPNGGLLFTTTSLTISAAGNAQVPPPAPEPNDIVIINTTALASGSDTQVMAYVTSPVGKSTAGNRTTYTLKLAQQLGTTVTADTGATVTAILVRPTAFVLKPTANGRELRMIELYPKGTSIDVNKNYTVLTSQIALASATATPSASDPMSDEGAKPFSLVTQNDRPFAKISLAVRASRYDNYLRNKQSSTVDTYVKTESVIALKCNQN